MGVVWQNLSHHFQDFLIRRIRCTVDTSESISLLIYACGLLGIPCEIALPHFDDMNFTSVVLDQVIPRLYLFHFSFESPLIEPYFLCTSWAYLFPF